jgi:hypothetical protein
VEGFSIPPSNKRTAGRPNPHPVGLQNLCSILLGSPPPWLSQTTAQRQTKAWRDPHLLGCTGSMHHRDTRPSATPGSSPVPQLVGIHPPHPAYQLHLGQPEPTPLTATHQAQQGSSSMWNDWNPTPLGQAPAWHETATSTSPPEPCPSGRTGPSSTGFPDNRSTKLLLGPPLEGSNHRLD